MAARRRLDSELVRRSLVPTREAAKKAIAAHQVTVNGAQADKASRQVLPSDAVELLAAAKYVGRGGDKLEGALAVFAVNPAAMKCVDVGSSTGGFTDCLLQAGATSVVAIDVGRAQLHDRLCRDKRVDVREQTDVRSVDPAEIGAPFDLVVIDVSFIGLDRILDIVATLAGEQGQIIALVKPQFEAGRQEVNKGKGIIRDPEIWERVLHESIAACRRRDLPVGGVDTSPLKGGAGNVEFFLWVGGAASTVPDTVDQAAVITAIARAGALP